MSQASRLAARGGLRAKILAAPVVALVLMAVMGAITFAKLNDDAALSKSMAQRTDEVEVLRDSNSRQFESDRHMYLALHAADAKEREDAIGESLDTLQEATDGYREFAGTAVTPELAAMGRAQAAIMVRIKAARVSVLNTIKAGRPVTADQLKEQLKNVQQEEQLGWLTAIGKYFIGIFQKGARCSPASSPASSRPWSC